MNDTDTDNIPLYQNKRYRKALELMNENVPLAVVKRRWYVKITVDKFNEQHKREQHRNAKVINAQLWTGYISKSLKVSFTSQTKR